MLNNKITFEVSSKIPLHKYFSQAFVQHMINSMIVAYHKYGDFSKRQKEKGYENAVKCIFVRLEMYEKTGNTEWLIDVANCCLIEFMYPVHPKAHFRPTSSEESPGID